MFSILKFTLLQVGPYVEPNDYNLLTEICKECTLRFYITSAVLLFMFLLGLFLKNKKFKKASTIGNGIIISCLIYTLFINDYPAFKTVTMAFGLFLFIGLILMILAAVYFLILIIFNIVKSFLVLKKNV